MDKLELEKIKLLFTCRWVNLFEALYRNKNGSLGTWQFVSRFGDVTTENIQKITPAAVVVVPYCPARHSLLLIKEFRVPIWDYEIGFPAGLLNVDEAPAEAARRELFEETGLEIQKIHCVTPPLYSSAGLTNESVVLVYCSVSGDINTSHNEEDEVIHPFFATPKECKALLADPANKFSAKSWPIIKSFSDSLPIF